MASDLVARGGRLRREEIITGQQLLCVTCFPGNLAALQAEIWIGVKALEAFVPLESPAFLLLPAPAGSLLSSSGGILKPCKFGRVPVGSGGADVAATWLSAARHRRARLRASGSAVTREPELRGMESCVGKPLWLHQYLVIPVYKHCFSVNFQSQGRFVGLFAPASGLLGHPPPAPRYSLSAEISWRLFRTLQVVTGSSWSSECCSVATADAEMQFYVPWIFIAVMF